MARSGKVTRVEAMEWPIESEEAFRIQILKMHRKENV